MASPTLDPGLAAYLTTNRDFAAAAVVQAIESLHVTEGARVLDAGTGGGGALPPLAQAVGRAGRVVGVDLNPAVVALASKHVAENGGEDRVTLRAVDVLEVLKLATSTPSQAFDAIWASDLVWPGNFDDPADTVRQMAGALRPGAVLALFYSNYYQSTFLPGHPRLERLLRTASELRWGLPAEGPTHNDRCLGWLLAAGLHDVRLDVFPRVGFPVDDDPTVRPYLESTVWPEMLESATTCGAEAGLSTAQLDQVRELLTPDGPKYVVDEPGYFILHPTVLASGRRPPTDKT